jgi:ribosomal protein L11 methyltransferase
MKLRVGRRFVVTRDAADPDAGARLPVILAHGRAFGSGEHETTRSCLEELEGISIRENWRVLDLGCGTGILSVAAARLGARWVLALDPCPNAIATTAATVRLNGMERVIFPLQADISALRSVRFQLITANLYGDILLQGAEAILWLLAPGGTLLLSGIPYGDEYDLKVRFTRSGCRLLKARTLEDYSTLVFNKEPY